nr:aminodeoxychorismate/anthranilate synthase component II [Natranaerofaba carboxydovora]
MIDNYDSFTYNLVQYLEELGENVLVKRNDEIIIDEIERLDPEIIVISPGPCTPLESGVSTEVVSHFKDKKPILGICLGHQTIAHVFGGSVIKGLEPVHGKVHPVWHDQKGVFEGLKNPLNVTRYHSLVVEKESLPEEFLITAETESGEIMGIKHQEYPLEGVQFHPEAVLTDEGHELLENFLKYKGVRRINK